MKTLKFNHELAQEVQSGEKTVTWRVNDEKNLGVDDEVWVIDKVERDNPDTWQAIGTARVTEILAKHLGDITNGELGDHAEFSSRQDMLHAFHQYYGSDINEHTPVKIIHFEFEPRPPKQFEKIEEKRLDNLTELKVYADGGSRGNPGPASSGYVLLAMDDTVIFQGGQYMGFTTNNQAEYTALKLGLEEALTRKAEIVHVYMDSLLVINQMKGLYKVRHPDLALIHAAIRALEPKFRKITYTHVPRELNKLADAMVNEVLDATDLS